MEKLIASMNTGTGLSGLLASLCVLLALQIVIKVGEFLWKTHKEKMQLSDETVKKLSVCVEQNTQAIDYLQDRLKSIEYTLLKVTDH